MSAQVVHPPIEDMSEDELTAALRDPLWRLSNLYKIMIKESEDDDDGLVITFKPNRAQRKLIKRLHTRNIILKARQLGFTTFIAILFLDFALFGKDNTRAGIVAHTEKAAKAIFRDKVKFAYRQLPELVRAMCPLERDAADELLFAHNNSSIQVSTSLRSGTIHYLHVSEFGKICAKFPDRAQEVITGTIPAVPLGGLIFIESTAEGREGEFFLMCTKAEANHDAGKELTQKDYAFHFFPWWQAPEYRMDPRGVVITAKDHEYFDQIEAAMRTSIDPEQRAWWVATRDTDFSGDEAKMWQEYPSTPAEAFQVSKKGCYYTKEITAMRKQKRIKPLPILPNVPCFTFWDIGSSDGTAIWVLQLVGHEWRAIHFYEAWGESYAHAVRWLQGLGLTWDTMYLPHDAAHERQGERENKSPKQMLEDLMPGVRFEIVPRIEDVNWGIQQTRDLFPLLWIDEERCKDGLVHLEAYRKKWNANQEVWSDKPDKAGGHSEAADALRQLGQALADNLININRGQSVSSLRRSRNWRTA
jgi:hypothetical protein